MPSRNVKGRLLRWQISYDKRVARLSSWKAKLLYTWIIPSLDNLGRMEGEPRLVRSMVLPLERLTDKQVGVLLEHIHNEGLLFWYKVNGEKYLQCPTIEKNIFFREGEGRNRMSDYPAPLESDYKKWVAKTRQDVARHVGEDLDLDLDKDLEKDKSIGLFWNYYLLKTKKSFSLTTDRKVLIQKALARYPFDRLKTAVDNFLKDDWPGRKDNLDLIYCIGKQRGKRDNLDHWVSYKSTPTMRKL